MANYGTLDFTDGVLGFGSFAFHSVAAGFVAFTGINVAALIKQF